MTKNGFRDLIERDRQSSPIKEDWTGNLLDYLVFLEEQEKEKSGTARIISQFAHARIYRMITALGYSILNDERTMRIYGRPIKSYRFFESEFYGISKAIEEIVDFFTAAAMGGEQSRQILALIGPVGSGKSSLVEILKNGFRALDPIFVIKDCPIHEEPLHLIPYHLRLEIEKRLNVRIEGDLCPVCRFHLKEKYKNKYEEMLIVPMKFSVRSRRGISSVTPVDPNTQDTSELIGEKDISKLDQYGGMDPRILNLNGAFNAGNRGIVEFIEMFRNPPEYFHPAVTATQEKAIPVPGKQGMAYFDGVIIGHSNEEGWNEFKNNPDNKLYVARIVPVYVPYALEVSSEVKIYKKIIKKSEYTILEASGKLNSANGIEEKYEIHIAPHAFEIAAKLAVMSRLAPTTKCDSFLTKMRLYDGEKITEKGQVKKINVPELKDDNPREGMSGIDTRFVTKAIFDFLAKNDKHRCINPINLRELLIVKIKEELRDKDKEQDRYLAFLKDDLHKDYLKILEKELIRSFVDAYEDKAEKLFNNYLDHVEAYVNKAKVKDEFTKEELEPDLKFMESIESQINVSSGSMTDQFRSDFIAYILHLSRNNEKISYKSYEPLKEAVERKLVSSVKDLARVITSSKARDKEQQKKFEEVVENMVGNGYCRNCCEVTLRFAANHIFRDN